MRRALHIIPGLGAWISRTLGTPGANVLIEAVRTNERLRIALWLRSMQRDGYYNYESHNTLADMIERGAHRGETP